MLNFGGVRSIVTATLRMQRSACLQLLCHCEPLSGEAISQHGKGHCFGY